MSDNNTNRGTHGDSSFMLDGLPSSSEKPLPLGMGYVTVSPQTVARAIKDQRLDAFKVGREWRIEREAVIRWVKK